MRVSNIKELTENQKEKISLTVRDLFKNKITDDWNHFSFLGTRLNLKSKKIECVFEVCTNEKDCFVFIDLNDRGLALNSTFKIN